MKTWLWFSVPVLALGELGAHFYFAGRAPREADWQQLPSVVGKIPEGTLVVVAPGWAEPFARQQLNEQLMPLRDVARPDQSAYARALEISILGESAPELAGWRTLEERRQGKFRLRLLENPAPAHVLRDFVDALEPRSAEVFEAAGSPREIPCRYNANARTNSGGLGAPPTFPAQRFECGSGEFFFAGVTVIDDQGFRPRRCIWAHPTPNGALGIRYRQQKLGERIHGYGATPWLTTRDGAGTAVVLEAFVDGASVGRFVHEDSAGWQNFEFSLGARGKKTADVEFRVSSENIKDRHFCFYADTR